MSECSGNCSGCQNAEKELRQQYLLLAHMLEINADKSRDLLSSAYSLRPHSLTEISDLLTESSQLLAESNKKLAEAVAMLKKLL
jgi:hypothetical protein